MKLFKKYIAGTLLFSVLSFLSFAGNCIDEIGKKLGDGNAAAVSAYFDDNLSLSLPGSQSSYSHAQAAMILNDFFKKNDAKTVSIERTGNNVHSRFAIGTLVTSKAKYRIYLLVKIKDNDCLIQELRLED